MKDTKAMERFIVLRGKNWSLDRIGKEIKVSKPILIKWEKDFEEEVSNVRAFEFEALQEKYNMNKTHKIQSYGEFLKKIDAELDSRDLAEVRTDKLLDMRLKVSLELDKERINISSSDFSTAKDIEMKKASKRFYDDMDQLVAETQDMLTRKKP